MFSRERSRLTRILFISSLPLSSSVFKTIVAFRSLSREGVHMANAVDSGRRVADAWSDAWSDAAGTDRGKRVSGLRNRRSDRLNAV